MDEIAENGQGVATGLRPIVEARTSGVSDEEDLVESVMGAATVRRLRELVGHREDAIVDVGMMDGDLLWISEPGSKAMFGRDLTELQGRSRFDYIHPDDLAAYRRKHQRAENGDTVRYTVRVSTADGDWRKLSAVMWQVETDRGPVIVSVSAPE